MTNHKITLNVELVLVETPEIMGSMSVETQTYHNTQTDERIGSLFTDPFNGNAVFLVHQPDGVTKVWQMDKDQFAKIFTAIYLQADVEDIQQGDLDDTYLDYMRDKL
jgi:hypothetical protein